jgi:D-glycero-D-manno-heptose 1,7-bisphosphate phosphatase
MDRELARHGATVDAYYFCPHHPDYVTGQHGIQCDCRKPLDGMLRRGAAEFSIDLAASFMIGDRLADVEAGLNSGCRPIMVRTGYGAAESYRLPPGVPVYDSLLDAVKAVISGKAYIFLN